MRFFGSLKEAFLRLLLPGSLFSGGAVVAVLITFMINRSDLNTLVLNIMPYVVLPVLIISAFSFLMKRSSTDMFHALPVKRHTVFITSLFICVLWMALCYLLGIGVSLICFGKCNIDYFTHLCTCVFIMGATSIGAVLTGRLFSSVVNTLIIALVPRLLYNTVLNSIFLRLPFVISDAPGMPEISYTALTPQPEERLLYLIAGAVLTVLAFILYIFRKSETAGMSAPNRVLRIFHNGIIAFSVSLIAINTVSAGKSFATAVLLYGISVILPFLYEFISTKRLSQLKHGFIAVIIMAVLNAGVYLFIGINVSKVQNEQLEIKGYQVINSQFFGNAAKLREDNDLYTWADWEKEHNQYGYLQTLDHFVTDEEACSLLNECYAISKQAFIDGNGEYYTDDEGVTRIKTRAVLLDENGERRYRYLYLSHNERTYFTTEVLSKDREFKDKASTLPEIEKVSAVTCTEDMEFNKRLYQCYYEEMMELEANERLEYTYTVYNQCTVRMYNEKSELGYRYIMVEGNDNGNDFYGCYWINSYDHPETYEMVKAHMQPFEAEDVREILTQDKSEYSDLELKLTCRPDKSDYPEKEKISSEELYIEKNSEIYYYYYVRVNNPNIETTETGYYRYMVWHKSFRDTNEGEIEAFFVRLGEFINTHQAEKANATGSFSLTYKKPDSETKTITIRLNFSYDEYVALIESIGGTTTSGGEE